MKPKIIDAEYYCENDNCPARTINVWIKLYEKTNNEIFNNRCMLCPMCSKKLKIHHEKEA